MNVYDWVFIGMTIAFLVAGIVAWLIYAQAKKEFLEKFAKMDKEDFQE